MADPEVPTSAETRPAETRESLFRMTVSTRVRNGLVIEALTKVDRKDFAPPDCEDVYKDKTIQLGDGASISQPTLVAEMMDWLALKGTGKVLEVGTGSGYNAALLSHCADQVYTIEYNPELAKGARERLERLGYENVEVIEGDGALGLPDKGPFDAIIVTAGLSEIPKNLALQLNQDFGRLVAPVGKEHNRQDLMIFTCVDGKFSILKEKRVGFHPLMSDQKGGWTKESIREVEERKKDFVSKMVAESGWSEEELQERITEICGEPIPPNLLAEIYSMEKLKELQQLLGKCLSSS